MALAKVYYRNVTYLYKINTDVSEEAKMNPFKQHKISYYYVLINMPNSINKSGVQGEMKQ